MTLDQHRENLGKGAVAASVVAWGAVQPILPFVAPGCIFTIGLALAVAVFLLWGLGDKVSLVLGFSSLCAALLLAVIAGYPAAQKAASAHMECRKLADEAATIPVENLASVKDRREMMGCAGAR